MRVAVLVLLQHQYATAVEVGHPLDTGWGSNCRGTPTPGVTGSAGFSSSESSGTVRAPCPSISLQAILNSGCRSLHTSRYSLPSCS